MSHQFSSDRLITPAVRDRVVHQAALASGVPADLITTQRRNPPIARARQHAMWLLRQYRATDGSALYSFPEIAMALGKQCHATVIHGIRAHERRSAKALEQAA